MTTSPVSATAWLTPEGFTRCLDHPVVMWPAGVLWDAVRTPADLALPALTYLLHENQYERRRLGPVLHDTKAGQVHFLVSPGHSATYPPGCRLIGRGGWLSTPTDRGPSNRFQWLHLPSTPRLSGPPWLAAALQHQHALNRTTLTTETPA
jgi:hypothetical protein